MMKNDLYLWLRIHWKSWEMDDEKSFINMIGIWKWLMKISENGKPIINTSEIIFWIIWWKNHDIHENKNVCPEFNGEKMHEHSVFLKTSFWQTLSLENHQKEADNSYAVKVVPSISPKISKNWGNNAKNNFLAKFLGKPGGRKWDQRISREASA